jgi:hypothetical protein
MAKAVSYQPLTTESRIQTRASPFGICGGQSGTGTGFSLSTSVPPRHHSTNAAYSFILQSLIMKNWTWLLHMFSLMNPAIANFAFIAIWFIIFQNALYWHLTHLSYFVSTCYMHHNWVSLVLSKLAQIIVLVAYIQRCPIHISSVTPSTLFGGFSTVFPKFLWTDAGVVPRLGCVSVLMNRSST